MKTMSAFMVADQGVDLTALGAELDVPVVSGLQHQGDVSVIPVAMVRTYSVAVTPVPREGVAVIQGEGGNTHLLLASGDVRFDVIENNEDIDLGSLCVAEGATAWLDHPEHGNSGIAPGNYVIRRKREQADQIRVVAD